MNTTHSPTPPYPGVYLTVHVIDSHAQMPQSAWQKQMGANSQRCRVGPGTLT